jgi:hypothetical protein
MRCSFPHRMGRGPVDSGAVQHHGRHDGPMLVKVITVCDHLCRLRYDQAEHEIFGKAFPVPFHCMASDSERPVNSSVLNGIIL